MAGTGNQKIASFIKKWVGETRFSKDATKNHEKCWKSMIFKRKVNISLLCCLIKGLLLIMMVENVFLKSFPKHFQHFSISWTCRRLWTLILGPKWTKIVYFPKKRRLKVNEFNLKWLLFTVMMEDIFLNTVLKIRIHFPKSRTCRMLWTFILGSKLIKIV